MRFAAGFLFGVFLAGALLPLGVLLGAALIGLGLGTIWARRRASTRRRRCPDCGHESVNCREFYGVATLCSDCGQTHVPGQ